MQSNICKKTSFEYTYLVEIYKYLYFSTYAMQLTNIKISNVLSYPYQPDLSKVEGTLFYNRENNNVNVLIGPNGAGKS